MPDRLAHPLDLVLAALVEDELEPRRAETPDAGGRGRAVLELDALGQAAEDLVRRPALDVGLVDLVHLVARVREPVRERAVVREEERARRVRVQAADRDDAPLVPDEPDHGRSPLRVAGRRDDPGRLVQEHVGERLGLDPLPVELDHVAALDEGRKARELAVHAHPSGLDQSLGAAARRDSGAGQVGVQAHSQMVTGRVMMRPCRSTSR